MKFIAIILARGGSKGLPMKNIIDFCGKPLIVWTIEHCIQGGVENVYVSSDNQEILDVSSNHGAIPLQRPENISGDLASSESGWMHALDVIERKHGVVDWILAPQVTSPLRKPNDIRKAIKTASFGKYDSFFFL